MSIRAVYPLGLFIVLFATGAARGQGDGGMAGEQARDTGALMSIYEARTRVYQPCPQPAPGEVVVCARRHEGPSPYRLPLREAQHSAGPLPGEPPRASAEPVRRSGCGIVPGDPPLCNRGLTIVKSGF